MTDSSTPPDGYAYDVFISYRLREPDKSWVRNVLLPRLEAAGLRVCIDVRDFRLGEPLVTEMERAVVESRYTLAVLSPAYLTSSFTDFENVISQHLGLEESQNRLLLAVREPCEWNLRLRHKVWLEMKDDEEVEENLPRLIRALGGPRGASSPGGPEQAGS